jgi:hypothetical protein
LPGLSEARVTEQLLALVDEPIHQEQARARARRRLVRVEEDLDLVQVSV